MDERFEPGVGGFDLSRHVGQLQADDRVLDELFAEGAALVGVFYRLLVADAREADTLDDYTDSLVIEVRHDDCTLLAVGFKGKCNAKGGIYL
jgi:hypothetical protein